MLPKIGIKPGSRHHRHCLLSAPTQAPASTAAGAAVSAANNTDIYGPEPTNTAQPHGDDDADAPQPLPGKTTPSNGKGAGKWAPPAQSGNHAMPVKMIAGVAGKSKDGNAALTEHLVESFVGIIMQEISKRRARDSPPTTPPPSLPRSPSRAPKGVDVEAQARAAEAAAHVVRDATLKVATRAGEARLKVKRMQEISDRRARNSYHSPSRAPKGAGPSTSSPYYDADPVPMGGNVSSVAAERRLPGGGAGANDVYIELDSDNDDGAADASGVDGAHGAAGCDPYKDCTVPPPTAADGDAKATTAGRMVNVVAAPPTPVEASMPAIERRLSQEHHRKRRPRAQTVPPAEYPSASPQARGVRNPMQKQLLIPIKGRHVRARARVHAPAHAPVARSHDTGAVPIKGRVQHSRDGDGARANGGLQKPQHPTDAADGKGTAYLDSGGHGVDGGNQNATVTGDRGNSSGSESGVDDSVQTIARVKGTASVRSVEMVFWQTSDV